MATKCENQVTIRTNRVSPIIHKQPQRMMTLNAQIEKMTEETPIDPMRMASAAAQASELMKTLGHKDRLDLKDLLDQQALQRI